MWKYLVILVILSVGLHGYDIQANVGVYRSGTCPIVCADPLPLGQLLQNYVLYEVASSSNNNRRNYECDVNRFFQRDMNSVYWMERFYDVATQCMREYRFIVSNGPTVFQLTGDYCGTCIPLYNQNCLIVLYCCQQVQCNLYTERIYAYSNQKEISCEQMMIIQTVLAKNNIYAPLIPTIQNATYCNNICF